MLVNKYIKVTKNRQTVDQIQTPQLGGSGGNIKCTKTPNHLASALMSIPFLRWHGSASPTHNTPILGTDTAKGPGGGGNTTRFKNCVPQLKK